MSHFAVLVVGDDVDAALAPFQENNMGNCPRTYLEFHDVEDEYRERYEKESTKQVLTPGGERVWPWDERFRVPGTIGTGGNTHRPPEDATVEVPLKEIYPTFERFMADYAGTKKDPKKKRYGYWENPNKKWDWWKIGGRYEGRLVTRAGIVCDQARHGELDFAAMQKARAKQAEGWWDEYEKDAARGDKAAAYFHGVREGEARGDYIARSSRFSAFAAVKDGKWYERGGMGWWGAVHDEKDPDKWEAEFDALVRNLSPEALLTIVDCHI